MAGIAAVLDLGTSHTSCWIGDADGVFGRGEVASEGISRGEVADLRALSACVRAAVTEAERQAGLRVQDVWAAISGSSVEGRIWRSAAPVLSEDQEISHSDVQRLLERAAGVGGVCRHGVEKTVLHVLPRAFWIDGRGPVREPVGLSGALLQAEVVVVDASACVVEDLARAVRLAGYRLEGVVAAPLASGMGALSQEERMLGALVIDIGAGVTNYSMWADGCLLACGCIGIGGELITRDIASGLSVSMETAEELKCSFSPGRVDGLLSANPLGGGSPKGFTGQELAEIIEARLEEILRLVLRRIAAFDLRQMRSGAVVAGGAGGNSIVTSLLKEFTGLDVRVARAQAEELPGPRNTLAAGLLAWATRGISEAKGRTNDRAARWRRFSRAFEWLAVRF